MMTRWPASRLPGPPSAASPAPSVRPVAAAPWSPPVRPPPCGLFLAAPLRGPPRRPLPLGPWAFFGPLGGPLPSRPRELV